MTLWAWASVAPCGSRRVADYLLHIPLGGKRDAREAARFRRMGVVPGVPDYLLHVQLAGFGGLWIEMKRPASPGVRRGTLSADQVRKQAQLVACGYRVRTVYGWSEARLAILEYLELGPLP